MRTSANGIIKASSRLLSSVPLRTYGEYNMYSLDLRSGDDYSEFSDPRNQEYNASIIRVVTAPGKHLERGPATLLIEGIPISLFTRNGLGFISIESLVGKKAYMHNATTDSRKLDLSQIPVTYATLFKRYLIDIEDREKNSNSRGAPYTHNETMMGSNISTFIPCIFGSQTDQSMNLLQEFMPPFRKVPPVYYEAETGLFFHFRDGKKAEPFEMAPNILSLRSYRNNPEMGTFIDKDYERSLGTISQYFAQKGGTPEELHKFGAVPLSFAEDIRAKTRDLLERSKDYSQSR